jgi:hypothetical protein
MIQDRSATYRIDRMPLSKWRPAAITISYAYGSLRCKQKHSHFNKNYVALPIHPTAWQADDAAFSCRRDAGAPSSQSLESL